MSRPTHLGGCLGGARHLSGGCDRASEPYAIAPGTSRQRSSRHAEPSLRQLRAGHCPGSCTPRVVNPDDRRPLVLAGGGELARTQPTHFVLAAGATG